MIPGKVDSFYIWKHLYISYLNDIKKNDANVAKLNYPKNHIPMLTFITMYLLRLYYPRWKEGWRYYIDNSRKGNYGRWASRKGDWAGQKGFSLGYS